MRVVLWEPGVICAALGRGRPSHAMVHRTRTLSIGERMMDTLLTYHSRDCTDYITCQPITYTSG